MKHMQIKYCCLMVLLSITFVRQTQGQSFMAKAGLNLSSASVTGDTSGINPNISNRPGFHIGITHDFTISRSFAIESGLLLSSKGFNADYSFSIFGTDVSIVGNSTFYYIDVPVFAKGYWEAGSVKFYGAIGPYMSIGLTGKSKFEASSFGSTESSNETIKFGTDLKRMDWGINMGGGAEYRSFVFGVNYGLGLSNISKDNSEVKNRVWAFSLGYRFGGKY